MSFEVFNAVMADDVHKVYELVLDEEIDVANAIKFASGLGKYEILKILLECRGYEAEDKVIVFALIEAAKNNRKECVEFIMDCYSTVDISKALEVSAPECIEIMTSKHDPFGYSKNTQNFFKF